MSELDTLIVELRTDLSAPIRLHARSAPVTRSLDGITDQTYGHVSGLPFTAAFQRRISHSDWWGVNELGNRSIVEVGDWCRSRHLSDLHRCPGRSTSLCQRIVSALAEYGQPIGHIAWREGLEPEVIEDLALNALEHAERWRHNELHRYMRLAREQERDTRVYCPECIGRRVSVARS